MAKDLYFSEDHQLFRKNLREFIDREINPRVEEWEAAEAWPAHEIFKKMGDAGFLGITMDPKWGGQGLDFWFDLVFLEELGRIDTAGVSVPISVQTHMATPALHQFGTDMLKERYLKPALAGDMVTAIAVTEPDAGSDVAGLKTRARKVGDKYIINGSKTFITNGAQADWVALLARTSDEPGHRCFTLFVVPTDTPGFHVSRKLKKMGWKCSDTCILAFEDMEIPADHVIGMENMGFIYQMQQFQHERLSTASCYMFCEKLINTTVKYLNERQAFGRPLIKRQAIRHRLAELQAEVESVRFLFYHCVKMMEAGQDATRYISMGKLKGARVARKVADECMQFYGGNGYLEEYPVARAYRDIRVISIGGGADEVMLEIIAKTGNIG